MQYFTWLLCDRAGIQVTSISVRASCSEPFMVCRLTNEVYSFHKASEGRSAILSRKKNVLIEPSNEGTIHPGS